MSVCDRVGFDSESHGRDERHRRERNDRELVGETFGICDRCRLWRPTRRDGFGGNICIRRGDSLNLTAASQLQAQTRRTVRSGAGLGRDKGERKELLGGVDDSARQNSGRRRLEQDRGTVAEML